MTNGFSPVYERARESFGVSASEAGIILRKMAEDEWPVLAELNEHASMAWIATRVMEAMQEYKELRQRAEEAPAPKPARPVTMPSVPAPGDTCPACVEEIRMGSFRWNGEAWEHKSLSFPQGGHHLMQPPALPTPPGAPLTLSREPKPSGVCPTCSEVILPDELHFSENAGGKWFHESMDKVRFPNLHLVGA